MSLSWRWMCTSSCRQAPEQGMLHLLSGTENADPSLTLRLACLWGTCFDSNMQGDLYCRRLDLETTQ